MKVLICELSVNIITKIIDIFLPYFLSNIVYLFLEVLTNEKELFIMSPFRGVHHSCGKKL